MQIAREQNLKDRIDSFMLRKSREFPELKLTPDQRDDKSTFRQY